MPWEDGSAHALFIWKTDDGFNMLYESKSGTCCATSDDGYRWLRPELGEVHFEGSGANNLLAHGITGSSGVFIRRAERRFAM